MSLQELEHLMLPQEPPSLPEQAHPARFSAFLQRASTASQLWTQVVPEQTHGVSSAELKALQMKMYLHLKP